MLRQPGAATSGGALRLGLLLCAIWFAACAPRTTRDVIPPPPAIGGEWSVPSGRAAWTLDESASELRVMVYRGGALARLGHNHVLRARQFEARAWEGPDGTLAGAGVDLRIPVAQFLVDDPLDRAAAGPEFAAAVSDEARSGTLANLLRAEVLDAVAFPTVRVRAAVRSLEGTSAVAYALVEVRGASRELEMPLELLRDREGLTARGQVAIRQTEVGIVPFSIGGGAIAVADELQVHFKLRFTPTMEAL